MNIISLCKWEKRLCVQTRILTDRQPDDRIVEIPSMIVVKPVGGSDLARAVFLDELFFHTCTFKYGINTVLILNRDSV